MTKQLSVEQIAGKIYFIRGIKVMLDQDLAELYGVETKQLKRAVKRNVDRFPADFMFELSKREYDSLRCQIGTLKRGGHSKYLPFAFTEQGVAMLSGILSSKRAIPARSPVSFLHQKRSSGFVGTGFIGYRLIPVTYWQGLFRYKFFPQIESLLHNLFISPDLTGIHGAPIDHPYNSGFRISISVLKGPQSIDAT